VTMRQGGKEITTETRGKASRKMKLRADVAFHAALQNSAKHMAT
jgi:predicted HicB family RNase H-like nuclease